MKCFKCGSPLRSLQDVPNRGRMEIVARCRQNSHHNYLYSRPMTADEIQADYHSIKASLPKFNDTPMVELPVKLWLLMRKWQSVRLV